MQSVLHDRLKNISSNNKLIERNFEGFQKLLFQEILKLFALGEIVFIGDFNSIELPESWYSFHVGGYNPIYN
jgi:hypothetical protein